MIDCTASRNRSKQMTNASHAQRVTQANAKLASAAQHSNAALPQLPAGAVKALTVATTLAALTAPANAQLGAFGTGQLIGNNSFSPKAVIGLAVGFGGLLVLIAAVGIAQCCCTGRPASRQGDVELGNRQAAPAPAPKA